MDGRVQKKSMTTPGKSKCLSKIELTKDLVAALRKIGYSVSDQPPADNVASEKGTLPPLQPRALPQESAGLDALPRTVSASRGQVRLPSGICRADEDALNYLRSVPITRIRELLANDIKTI